MLYDCIIIGGGPAGLTAALYLARYHRNFIVLDSNESRASLIPKSHNYPGFKYGISGPKIISRLHKQLTSYSVKIKKTHATNLSYQKKQNQFVVSTKKSRFYARKVLLATGLIDIEPELPNLKNAIKSGLIRHCPICDAYEITNKKIAVLVKDNDGIKMALFLKTYTQKITILTLGNKFKLTAKNKQQLQNAKIPLITSGIQEVILKRKKIHAFKVNGQLMSFDTIYSALGVYVRSELALNMGVKCAKDQCLKVNDKQETKIKGLYASGDVVSGLHQICVAMAQAAIAATEIHNAL